MLCLVAQSCPTLCDPMDCSPPGSSIHGDSPGKNTKVGCHALLQGIFPTQRVTPRLLPCRRILYRLRYQGGPAKAESQIFSSDPFPSLVVPANPSVVCPEAQNEQEADLAARKLLFFSDCGESGQTLDGTDSGWDSRCVV